MFFESTKFFANFFHKKFFSAHILGRDGKQAICDLLKNYLRQLDNDVFYSGLYSFCWINSRCVDVERNLDGVYFKNTTISDMLKRQQLPKDYLIVTYEPIMKVV